MAGPMKFLLTSSNVNRRVIRSISAAEYCDRSIRTPPFAPPNGTFTIAHLYVIIAASAITSSSSTCGANRIPPFVGNRCTLCCARHPSITAIEPSSRFSGNVMW